MSLKKLHRTNYYVAWIAPVSDLELLPSRLMLDEEHQTPDYDTSYDDNIYICGSMAGHNVVIATCPPGLTGNVNAGHVTGSMFKTFPGIRMALLVGIGGGVPVAYSSDDPTKNIHLGDVVIGWPGDGGPACVPYDSGRWHVGGKFESLGTIDKPDRVLLNALGKLSSDHEMDRSTFEEQRQRLLVSKHKRKFTYPGLEKDQLFSASYPHAGQYNDKCADCDLTELVKRPERTLEEAVSLTFHRGRIATGNAVIQDGEHRDRIREQCNGALCIEMEAAGVDVSRSCLVIRGISDYSDSHKGDTWRSYAAGNAAIFARELLSKIPPGKVSELAVKEVPKRHFMVPFGRNPRFVGQENVLAYLLKRIPPHMHEDMCQRTVVQGLGGIGKTQVAIEAAYRIRDSYPDCSIFWVPAVSLETFESAYRTIGRHLGIQGIDDEKADIKTLVKEALNQYDGSGWLLILDNADDWELLFTNEKLMSYLPTSRRGSILFTTRNHQAGVRFDSRGNLIKLHELEEPDARQLLLLDLDAGQIGDIQTTTELLKHLAYLPLAIRQASAYLQENTNITVSKYLSYCESSDQSLVALLSKDFNDQDRYDVIKNPVATTWLVSFEQITRDKPLAAEYLMHICYFAVKDIPMALLPSGEHEQDQDEAIGTLTAYAFITKRRAGDRFDIHRLVGLVMRNWLQQRNLATARVTKTIELLGDVFPRPDHENREIWTAYMAHVHAILEHRDLCTDQMLLQCLLLTVGCADEILGNYSRAAPSLQQALTLSVALRGVDHLETADIIHHLAFGLHELGRFEEAKSLIDEVIDLRKKVLGQEHPRTLQSMYLLAQIIRESGKPREAAAIARQALDICEKNLGPEHRLTLDGMAETGYALTDLAQFEEAEILYRRALQAREKALGSEHPDTLRCLGGLANTVRYLGRYVEAEQMEQDCLRLHEKVLGIDHPFTVICRGNLAITLRWLGRCDEAERMQQRVVQALEKRFGLEHPDTLWAKASLACIYEEQQRYDEAETLERETLQLMTRILGPEHPDTMDRMQMLARIYAKQERYDEAQTLYGEVSQLRKKVLGVENSQTLDTMCVLADIHLRQQKFEEAEHLLQETLQLGNKALRPDHRHNLRCIDGLTHINRVQGRQKDAARLGMLRIIRTTCSTACQDSSMERDATYVAAQVVATCKSLPSCLGAASPTIGTESMVSHCCQALRNFHVEIQAKASTEQEKMVAQLFQTFNDRAAIAWLAVKLMQRVEEQECDAEVDGVSDPTAARRRVDGWLAKTSSQRYVPKKESVNQLPRHMTRIGLSEVNNYGDNDFVVLLFVTLQGGYELCNFQYFDLIALLGQPTHPNATNVGLPPSAQNVPGCM
ncbi:kinesin light chain [Paramyrothecium foliicola]|nr:kinesin light chain [Paramyrothecium foliicola]